MTALLSIPSTKSNPQILVVEDDVSLNEQLTELLRGIGMKVTQSFDGQQALELAVQHTFDLILLDLMLPGKDGLSVLSILRHHTEIPVIIVSAKHAEQERIQGLSAGADDYLSKPFNKDELVLRIDAILRRTLKFDSKESEQLSLENLKADKKQQTIYIEQSDVPLTPTEFGLFWTLLLNHGEVLSKAFLYQTVFKRQYSQYDRSLDMHLSRVRRKLAEAGWDGTRLRTVHGKGYVLS